MGHYVRWPGLTVNYVPWGVTSMEKGQKLFCGRMSELNGDVQHGKNESCLEEERLVIWKRNGAKFEIK